MFFYRTVYQYSGTETNTTEIEPDVFNNTDQTDQNGTAENGTSTRIKPTDTENGNITLRQTIPSKYEYIPWYLRNMKPSENSTVTEETTWDSDTTTSTDTTERNASKDAATVYQTPQYPYWYPPGYYRYTSWLPRTTRPTTYRYPWRTSRPLEITTPSWYTTTEKPSWDPSWYYKNSTWSSSRNQSTAEGNTAGPCKSCNRVNISINSKINQNDETGNHTTTFTSFLKQIVGKIIPSAINIAPNSNATNVAVASGNGNMFFYVFN